MYPLEFQRYTFYIKPLVRLCLIAVIVTSTVSITITWTAVISLILLTVSYLFFKTKNDKDSKVAAEVTFTSEDLVNPYKGKTGSGHLTSEKEVEIARAISEYVVDDGGQATCLDRFEVIKANTECIFAKRAKLWGSCDYDETLSLEENMRRVYPTLLKFTFAFMDLGLGAFVVELPGAKFGQNIEVFGDAVRRTLVTLRREDLKRINKRALNDIMSDSSQTGLEHSFKGIPLENTKVWERRSWVFMVNRVTFFLTSFAPFYPETNSRYSFGCKNCYLLLQPEISFAIHDLPDDTAITNWTCPVTVRDKIRVAFNNAGRYYDPPLVLNEPMVFDIVKRIYPDDEAVRWWDLKGS